MDRNKTNPYEFYQFFLNQSDNFSVTLLKYFTFLTEEQIESINIKHLKEPSKRIIQKKLANILTEYVYSKEDLENAIKLSTALFNNKISDLKYEVVKMLFSSLKTTILKSNINLIDALLSSKIASSKREANNFLDNKASSYEPDKEACLASGCL